MSGDSQRADEPDFLDDDFVIEDLAAKGDDLEQLFEEPAAAARPQPAKPAGEPDSDDVLFTDHTPRTEPSEKFQSERTFAEDAKSAWQGENLELDEDAPTDPRVAAAAAAVNDELGALLHGDEELPLDAENELELVDGPSATDADGIDEVEQSGPFVLDDGDGAWQEQPVADTAPDIVLEGQGEAPAEPIDAEVAEGVWEAVQEPAMAAHADEAAAEEEAGWEALPETGVDELAEVGEVERADEQPTQEELDAVEGHDIYAEDEPEPVLVGPVAGRRRTFGMVAALAASVALVGGAALMVMRPEWVGLTLEPQRVQQVQLERPAIQVALSTPVTPTPQLGHADPQPQPQPQPDVPVPTPSNPVAADPAPAPQVDPAPLNPPASDPTPAVHPADPVAIGPQPEPAPTLPPGTAVGPVPDGPATAPALPAVQWPVATAEPARPPRNVKNGKPLVRVDEEMMLGDVDPQAPRTQIVQAVEGVVPGTRAFAQLRNGNYFIGSIKVASADTVTLKLADGEVTLAADEISRLTALGSADYEALQKATSGFVRLTNNNRLVGGILSQIADDHIVLEFRSNRVMLPKSAISQVGSGEDEQSVRLDITREEDDWVRTMMERELGKDTKSEPAPGPKRPLQTVPKSPAPAAPPPGSPR
jgi:hypothetical protein